jgi:hypothetical protein
MNLSEYVQTGLKKDKYFHYCPVNCRPLSAFARQALQS